MFDRDQENLFQTIVENAGDGIIIGIGKGEHVYANKRAAEITGYTVAELMRMQLKDLVHRDELEKVSTRFEKIITGQPFKRLAETIVVGKSGQEIPIEAASARLNWGDEPANVVIFRDVRERKRNESKLHNSRERFRNLAEATNDMIWELDKDLSYTYVSFRIYDILGYLPEEIMGTKPCELMPSAESGRFFKKFRSFLNEKKPFYCLESVNLHKNGREVFLESSGIPVFNEDGEFTGYRGVDRDITHRKRTEADLKRYQVELERRVESRTRELEEKKNHLEETNTALEVLLRKRKEDKEGMEEDILTNVKNLIEPYLAKIRRTKLDAQQQSLLGIVESNLNEITSSFSRSMSYQKFNLTPQEIRITNLIKLGKSSKKIAEILNLSHRTIDTHRRNIRRKFGIKGKQANLRSHLSLFD